MHTETWRTITQHPDYDVSSHGRVRSRRRPGPPRILRPGDNGKGYLLVALQGPTGQRTQMVHRLVGEAFLGPRPPGMVTRHLNGDSHDNRIENLTYGTQSQNARDTVTHGHHHLATLTHCPAGHPYDDTNTRHHDGRRHCRTCQKRWNAARDRRGEKARLRLRHTS